eukprot:scaffold279_cov229-Pinguiococcus_pyrenoidosus.AAC.6
MRTALSFFLSFLFLVFLEVKVPWRTPWRRHKRLACRHAPVPWSSQEALLASLPTPLRVQHAAEPVRDRNVQTATHRLDGGVGRQLNAEEARVAHRKGTVDRLGSARDVSPGDLHVLVPALPRRQTAPSPRESDEARPLLVVPRVDDGPEVLNDLVGVLVPRVVRVCPPPCHVEVGPAADHDLRLGAGVQSQSTQGEDHVEPSRDVVNQGQHFGKDRRKARTRKHANVFEADFLLFAVHPKRNSAGESVVEPLPRFARRRRLLTSQDRLPLRVSRFHEGLQTSKQRRGRHIHLLNVVHGDRLLQKPPPHDARKVEGKAQHGARRHRHQLPDKAEHLVRERQGGQVHVRQPLVRPSAGLVHVVWGAREQVDGSGVEVLNAPAHALAEHPAGVTAVLSSEVHLEDAISVPAASQERDIRKVQLPEGLSEAGVAVRDVGRAVAHGLRGQEIHAELRLREDEVAVLPQKLTHLPPRFAAAAQVEPRQAPPEESVELLDDRRPKEQGLGGNRGEGHKLRLQVRRGRREVGRVDVEHASLLLLGAFVEPAHQCGVRRRSPPQQCCCRRERSVGGALDWGVKQGQLALDIVNRSRDGSRQVEAPATEEDPEAPPSSAGMGRRRDLRLAPIRAEHARRRNDAWHPVGALA